MSSLEIRAEAIVSPKPSSSRNDRHFSTMTPQSRPSFWQQSLLGPLMCAEGSNGYPARETLL